MVNAGLLGSTRCHLLAPGQSARPRKAPSRMKASEGLIRQQFGTAAADKYAQLYSQLKGSFPATASESTAYQIFNPYFAALVAGAGVAGAAQAVGSGVAQV